MTRIKVKGFKIFKSKGKMYCYHRATNTPIDLTINPIGSAGFFAECDRVTKMMKASDEAKPGSLGLLIKQYSQHDAFQNLSKRTRADYQRVFDYLKPIANTPLIKFDTPLIVRIRDKAVTKHGFRFGNYTRTVFSLLFAWGKERGYISTNPASGIKAVKRPKHLPSANRPWSDNEREAVLNALPGHLKLPIALMMFTGVDPQDSISILKSEIANGCLNTNRGKTGEAVWIELPNVLQLIIDASPKHNAITMCANSYGLPWTGSGLRASWRRVKLKLENEHKIGKGLTLKGLRHTVATILAEMGKTPEEIKNVLGQKTDAMARHYSRHANLQKSNTATVADFSEELDKRRTNSVKLSK